VHELEALQTIHGEVVALGGSLVVISPQQPTHVSDMAKKHKLGFPILWDERCIVATSFGLTFELPDDLRELYRSVGIDLAAHNGDPSWRLPVPARFVIDHAGRIASVEADPDYTRRPEPEATLAHLRKVAGKS
jgi:peroxiredoxin